ncbi:MAG TPA: aldehyde ferredoxin oxidoreductase C-terminal domain-containing protein, partial [Spirochaetales bacterium]|nr:aldehyde ferredoxin oxidoreductase C-terminal domain-containing protein [Spirochaetales bacterium]
GFDAISVGGVLAWLMDCLDTGALSTDDLGVTRKPHWNYETFDVIKDSLHNAELGCELIDSILEKRGIIDFSEGIRKWGRKVRKTKNVRILDSLVYTAHGRKGWMIPNQYWTPGALAPMAIMGKYYMHYGSEFYPPRKLGQICAERLKKELIMDNAGVCRFHRAWAEEMIPGAFDALYQCGKDYIAAISVAASRINSRNASVYWESDRDRAFVHKFLERILTVEKKDDPELTYWADRFAKEPEETALDFWFEMRKGIDESLRDFM